MVLSGGHLKNKTCALMNAEIVRTGCGQLGQAGVQIKPTLFVLTGSFVVLYGNLVIYPRMD